eukprot:CAMPEP_0172512264 /NCGR_PEP_ID=MMETSP1066-20121228/242992_1 /TAXON_ID=671091 /ORGANISM="Coscinodiscus wailesii, Strain CCMP2513" /LENGTH=130 /DNA_ID=CAMNT_0013291993 /DNA_START=61 /DNA_END=449 /DNA_ORIENTATION=+
MGNNKRSKKKKKNAPKPPPSSSSPSSSQTNTTTTGATAPVTNRETNILSELKRKCQCLLTAMKGVTPDGTVFVTPNHPLSLLHDSISSLTNELVSLQRRRRPPPPPLLPASDATTEHLWKNFSSWLATVT